MSTRIQIGGPAPYPVVIGAGVLGELPGLVGSHVRAVALIHAAGLGEVARPVQGPSRPACGQISPRPV